MFEKRLSIAVIHHKTPDLLSRCLNRLQQFAPGASVAVVDTAPSAEVGERIARSFPDIAYLGTSNHSLAHAANVGLEWGTTPYLAHMNADVLVGPTTFANLLAAASQPGVGIVGPINLTAEQRPHNLGLPYRRHYRGVRRTGRASVPVPWLAGSLHVVTRTALDSVGGLDTSFRFYNEDIDWCERMNRAGFGCLLVATDVTHLGGRSTPPSASFMIEGLRGGMVVSQRYRPVWYRVAHRWLVGLAALYALPFSADPERRRALRSVARMFAIGRFEESPFGATLNSRNPAFWGDQPGT